MVSKTIKEKRKELDKNICVRCGTKEKLCVHHLTYEREGKEKLSDLITLCRYCHGLIHRSEFRKKQQIEIEITKDCYLEMSKQIFDILGKPKKITYYCKFYDDENFLIINKSDHGLNISKSTSKKNFHKIFIPKLKLFKCRDYSFNEIIIKKEENEIQIKIESIF